MDFDATAFANSIDSASVSGQYSQSDTPSDPLSGFGKHRSVRTTQPFVARDPPNRLTFKEIQSR